MTKNNKNSEEKITIERSENGKIWLTSNHFYLVHFKEISSKEIPYENQFQLSFLSVQVHHHWKKYGEIQMDSCDFKQKKSTSKKIEMDFRKKTENLVFKSFF